MTTRSARSRSWLGLASFRPRTKAPAVQTPVPNLKPTAAPPSRAQLPPSLVKSDALQRGFDDSTVYLGKQELAKGNRRKVSGDLEDSFISVTTMAGENRGAFMEINESPEEDVAEGISDHHLLHQEGNPRNGGRRSSGSEGKDRSNNGKEMGSVPMKAFTNNNVQIVNNSIMRNSSCICNDPGVHLALSRRSAGAGSDFVINREK